MNASDHAEALLRGLQELAPDVPAAADLDRFDCARDQAFALAVEQWSAAAPELSRLALAIEQVLAATACGQANAAYSVPLLVSSAAVLMQALGSNAVGERVAISGARFELESLLPFPGSRQGDVPPAVRGFDVPLEALHSSRRADCSVSKKPNQVFTEAETLPVPPSEREPRRPTIALITDDDLLAELISRVAGEMNIEVLVFASKSDCAALAKYPNGIIDDGSLPRLFDRQIIVDVLGSIISNDEDEAAATQRLR